MAGEVHAGLAQMGEANATPDPSLVAVAESLKALGGKAILDSDAASKALAELGRLLMGSPAPTASELERLELPRHLLALLQRDTFSTEELVTHLGVEEATPALISTLLSSLRPPRRSPCVRCQRTSARPQGSACSPSPSSLPSTRSSTPGVTGGRRNFGATGFRWTPWCGWVSSNALRS